MPAQPGNETLRRIPTHKWLLEKQVERHRAHDHDRHDAREQKYSFLLREWQGGNDGGRLSEGTCEWRMPQTKCVAYADHGMKQPSGQTTISSHRAARTAVASEGGIEYSYRAMVIKPMQQHAPSKSQATEREGCRFQSFVHTSTIRKPETQKGRLCKTVRP